MLPAPVPARSDLANLDLGRCLAPAGGKRTAAAFVSDLAVRAITSVFVVIAVVTVFQ
jgi:hypothetical protein